MKRTKYAKFWWSYAKRRIPKGTKLMSVEKTNSVVGTEFLGVFFRTPGKDANTFMRLRVQ